MHAVIPGGHTWYVGRLRRHDGARNHGFLYVDTPCLVLITMFPRK